MKELFKYFSKIVSNKTIEIKALDIIFNAMRGNRVFQPMNVKIKFADHEKLNLKRAKLILEIEKCIETEVEKLQKKINSIDKKILTTKDNSEEIKGLKKQIYKDLKPENRNFIFKENNYFDIDTGESLTDFTPSENLKKLINTI